MKKTLIAAVLCGLTVGAQAAPANPLMRPVATAPANKPNAADAKGRMGIPPAPPPIGNYQAPGAAPEEAQGQDGAARKPVAGSTTAMRQALAKFVVVSISGDMAVLRPLPTYAGVPVMATQQYGQQYGQQGMQGAMPMGASLDPMNMPGMAQNQNAQAQVQQVPRIYTSILLQHKKKTFIQDAEVVPVIQDGLVVLRLATTDQVVFTGRIEGSSGRATVTGLDQGDQSYVNRNSPPVSTTTTNGTSSGNAPTNGMPASPNAAMSGGLR